MKKPWIHARVTGLPICPELTRDTVPKSSDIGCFLSVSGAVEYLCVSIQPKLSLSMCTQRLPAVAKPPEYF